MLIFENYLFIICSISSNDLPRVSGMKKIPHRTLKKHMKPKTIIQLNIPNKSTNVVKTDPSTNRMIHMTEMAIVRQVCRIYNTKDTERECNV